MRSTVFIGLFLLYCISLLWKYDIIEAIDFFEFYFADLLAMPLILEFSRVVLNRLKKREKKELSIPMITVGFVYTAILFEWVLPQYSDKYTADFYDVLCYGIGTVFYMYFVYQIESKKQETQTFREGVRIQKQEIIAKHQER